EARQFTTEIGSEWFFCLEAASGLNFQESLDNLLDRYDGMQQEAGLGSDTEVLLRFHLSDISNQAKQLKQVLCDREGVRFSSMIGQPPSSGSKVAMEAYHIHANRPITKETLGDANLLIKHGDYQSIWVKSRPLHPDSSYRQTHELFNHLSKQLGVQGGSLKDDTIRTWIYVRDVDNNYQDFVDARRELFDLLGMFRGGHYISSTGIEGHSAKVSDMVSMDSLSIFGLHSAQIEFLSAPAYLCPTHDYNVTFERGTRVVYKDRAHYYISGTASIDYQGNVLHVGNVEKQAERILINIQALLEDKGSALDDLQYLVIYLRDSSDWQRIQDFLYANLPKQIPHIIVQGAVCRPLWLIEMEGIAASIIGNDRFRLFC
ncbi:MAG: Rid family hydrolase, partial [bacterium]